MTNNSWVAHLSRLAG